MQTIQQPSDGLIIICYTKQKARRPRPYERRQMERDVGECSWNHSIFNSQYWEEEEQQIKYKLHFGKKKRERLHATQK